MTQNAATGRKWGITVATPQDFGLLLGRQVGEIGSRRNRHIAVLNRCHQFRRALLQHLPRPLHRCTVDIEHLGGYRV